jgi:RND family efflux transporter MFP subunit
MNPDSSVEAPPRRSLLWRALRFVVRVVLPVLVLAAGGWAAKQLLESGPSAKRRPPTRRARLVEVVRARRGDHSTSVQAMGVVRPAREVVVKARVEGEVLEAAGPFVPGARLAEDALILRLDARDYELTVRQRESELAKARADLAVERGNQVIAQRESDLLGEESKDEDRALLLRKPQLAIAEAAVKKAEAALDDARLDVQRTIIRAPFNAVVRERMVDLGAQVTPGTELVRLVGTDEYWVEVSIPVDQLRWIEIPAAAGERGAAVTISDESAWGSQRRRSGHVLCLLSDLEAEGRMARLLVSVGDPLADPPMLLDAYVRVAIEGRNLEGVVDVDRRLLRDGDRVWVMNEQSRLEIRPVEIAFRERDRVFVSSGIEDGERLVASDLSSVVEGMPLRLAEEKTEPAPLVAGSTDAPDTGSR